jgi:menaquinone-9 beta-reductase
LKKIVIIGGGLAGLVSAIILSRKGLYVHVIEKKTYPFHRVCGEYISNETVPFLQSLDLFPEQFSPPRLRNFLLSATSGKYEKLPLDLGGFGLSRYIFDEFLYKKAQASGAEFWLNTEAENIVFHESANKFEINTSRGNIIADVVIGSFGKRSRLDIHLNRSFIQKRSP